MEKKSQMLKDPDPEHDVSSINKAFTQRLVVIQVMSPTAANTNGQGSKKHRTKHWECKREMNT